ncbi:MAG: amidohydrolase family protein [Bryobacteraceae bacterium]
MPNPPLTNYGLSGRIVTMNASDTVIESGTVFVEAGKIVSVEPSTGPRPRRFRGAPVIETGGTIYPGLIELHNHLPYNVLPLWNVPKKFVHRGQWTGIGEYKKLVSQPMAVLAKKVEGGPPAIVRYVECKCLMGGVTTSQGIRLMPAPGIERFHKGVVRNAEEPDDESLAKAATRVADVDARSAETFLAQLKRAKGACLLHLSEGLGPLAREHFLALRIPGPLEKWAITPALAGIHCAGLEPEDFAKMAELGGSMIWSPFSNLLLYGGTAKIGAAREAGVTIAVGSDWSPSGSKNLLGELKVARLVNQELNAGLRDLDLVAMATRNPAKILGWTAAGSIEAGKVADLLVIGKATGDAYETLLRAAETDVSLVAVRGVARYGKRELMNALGPLSEEVTVGGQPRAFQLTDEQVDPLVAGVKFGQARDLLRDKMAHIPELARSRTRARPSWTIVLDHTEPPGVAMRPKAPYRGKPTGQVAVTRAGPQPFVAVDLDPVTVADDPKFFENVTAQRNLPDYVKQGLPGMFGS